jgi:RNA polymerase sigma-70 factor (ECF subfamily)
MRPPAGEATIIQDDHVLGERMRKGDAQALATLFRRHYAMLYDYGLKLSRQEELAKDSIQEVFASS